MSGRPIAPRPLAYAAIVKDASPQPVHLGSPLSRSAQTQIVNANASAILHTTSTPTPAMATASPGAGASSGGNIPSAYRKKVTSACYSCQKKRVKCDGMLPCSTCVKTSNECAYTKELDGRSIKRKYHEVQRDQDLLNDLIDTIRSSNDDYVNQLVSLIRSEASVDEIKDCVSSQLVDMKLTGKERSPDLVRPQSGPDSLQSSNDQRGRSSQRLHALDIRRLADQPLYKLPAKPWTNVTDDDDLVSNLISLWLTWDVGWHDWINVDLFIRDMQAGSLDTPFCSPFLVNCLLAWSCPYSDYKEARTVNGAPSKLCLDFITEAKRLLDDETNECQYLTMIGGLFVLYATLACSGKDIAYRYLLQSVGLVPALLASPLAAKSQSDTVEGQQLSDSIDRISWAVYILSTRVQTILMLPQEMGPPKRARPGRNQPIVPSRTWIPYPYDDRAIPSYEDEMFYWGCDLAVIEAELSRVLFNTGEPISRQEQEKQRLAIYNDLVARLSHLRQPEIELNSCPSLYTHQARIQTVILRIFLDLQYSTEGASMDVVTLAKAKCIEAALEIARLVKLYSDSWGASNIAISAGQSVMLSLTTLMEAPDTLLYSLSITDLCVTLRAMSRRWPIGVGMLRIIQMRVRMKGWVLPPQADRLFEDFEGQIWPQRQLKAYASVYQLPDTSKSGTQTGEEVSMGRFLEAIDTLELDEKAMDTSPPQ